MNSKVSLVLGLLLSLLLAACAEEAQPAASVLPTATTAATVAPLPAKATATFLAPVAVPTATTPATISAAAGQAPDPGPFPAGADTICGILLPVLPTSSPAPTTTVASTRPEEAVPEAARPALDRMLQAPETVGLVAYEVGQENAGIFFNPNRSMPLASVVKIVHLVTYAQAVQSGELDPQTRVPLAELERYYLANSDLNAHPEAVETLRAEGLVSGEPPSVPLEAVPRMMVEFSSNAATDYLHQLLGQERLEKTIVDLGLKSHTAPCPFLGQFLLMGNGNGIGEVRAYFENPARYSREVWAATEAYAAGESGRNEWRGRWRRPSIETQAYFAGNLNAQASAADYATLMARIAENELGPWEQNVRIRRYLEWPTFFTVNQQSLAWLGYKGGSLPGVLTVAYYAQPWDTARPVVVVLFFRDLPLGTYRQWRRSLAHDELARWLLYEREAIPLVREMLEMGD